MVVNGSQEQCSDISIHLTRSIEKEPSNIPLPLSTAGCQSEDVLRWRRGKDVFLESALEF